MQAKKKNTGYENAVNHGLRQFIQFVYRCRAQFYGETEFLETKPEYNTEFFEKIKNQVIPIIENELKEFKSKKESGNAL